MRSTSTTSLTRFSSTGRTKSRSSAVETKSTALPDGLITGWLASAWAGAPSAVVAEGKLFPAAWRTPKERLVLNRVEAHLAEGRNVLIFLLHTGKSRLPDRYLRLFREQLGERAVFLDVGKVKAADREDWLNRHVIEPGRRILITNPKAVQTGLNNLVAFSRAIWVQGLDYDARVVRQANGPTEGPSTVGGYPAAPGVPGQSAPPPPPPPPPPTPKVRCPECSHEFFVGQVATVTCPNCGSDVDTGLETPGEEGD